MFHFVLFAELSFWSLVSFAGFRACLIYMCLTVYEFYFILLIHHIILLILISVLSVTFWTLTYYKIYFFWSRTVWYETIELFIFVTCLEMLTHISWLSTPGNHAWLNRHCYPIGCVIKSSHQGICSCSPIVNFFKFTFHHGMATSVIFLIKN